MQSNLLWDECLPRLKRHKAMVLGLHMAVAEYVLENHQHLDFDKVDFDNDCSSKLRGLSEGHSSFLGVLCSGLVCASGFELHESH